METCSEEDRTASKSAGYQLSVDIQDLQHMQLLRADELTNTDLQTADLEQQTQASGAHNFASDLPRQADKQTSTHDAVGIPRRAELQASDTHVHALGIFSYPQCMHWG